MRSFLHGSNAPEDDHQINHGEEKDDGRGDGRGDGEESTTSRYDFDFDNNMNNNNNKPPPQPATAAVNSIHWDVEEDHLLSYFLGANEGGANNNANANENTPEAGVARGQQQQHHQQQQQQSPMMTAATSPTSHPGSMASIAEGVAGLQHHSSLDNFVHSRAMDSSSGLSTSSSFGGLPPTPAVHVYNGHHQHQQQVNHVPSGMAMAAGGVAAMPTANSGEYNSFVHASQQHRHSASSLQSRTSSQGSMHKVPSRLSTASTGSNSSSSSLTSMAAALALGGPNQVMYMQQKLQNRDQITGLTLHNNTTSPITPVMGMGSPSGQEMMMLPPPPRFPYGAAAPGMMMQQQMPQNMQQQHIMHQAQHPQMQQQHQPMMHMQQQVMPQPVQSNLNQQQVNVATQNINQQLQQQQLNFLPQMNPPVQQPIQHQQPTNHMGFPDPNSVTSAILAQTQRTHQPQQQQQLPSSQSQTQLHQQQVQQQQPQVPQLMPVQPQQQQHQIQIGLNGHSIPLTAVPAANGTVFYQIDPNAAAAALPPGVAPAGLRYFAKAINEVSKADEKEIDPKILAEKRQQRLARNRESARQSRRRKKEHLSHMAAKVQKLQRQLETEVRNKIRSMEGGIVRQQGTSLDKWMQKCALLGYSTREELAGVLQKTGPNCSIRRAVISHQYDFLRQAFLSTHNHYSLWMMMQNSSFFTEASRKQQNSLALEGAVVTAAGSALGSGSKATTTNTRANSKQIGEEIYNEEKDKGRGVNCHAREELKTWPLYCHEITMTMEQEDRIINQAHAQAKNTPNIQPNLEKMKKATDATKHLQTAMMCHTQLASLRNKRLLLEVLTPAQTALYLKWFKANKQRCRGAMDRKLRANSGLGESMAQNESTLGGVYRQLEDMRLEK